jgi:secondary thiamine-phosphate synthase enzyme
MLRSSGISVGPWAPSFKRNIRHESFPCGHYMSGLPLPPECDLNVWIQCEIQFKPRPRGFHLVTREVEEGAPKLRELEVGLATLLIQHTSASLTLNENASPDVRRDFAAWFDDTVPEGAPYWTHTVEGPDDMPAHIKASLTGSSLLLPVRAGRFALGTWQGIYLCEHRDSGGPRTVLLTAFGERRETS